MKKKLVFLCVLGLTLLTGCGKSTNVIEGQVKTLSTGQNSLQTEEKQVLEKKQVQQTESSEQYKGYIFIYDDIAIEIDAESEPIVKQLGEANAYFEAPSCAFEGIDRMYTYNNFELDTYPVNNIDHISAIIFKDDMITTAEGVGIGDSAEKVAEIYGEDAINESGMVVYEKDGMKLCFIIKEDMVVSVEYRSTVLTE